MLITFLINLIITAIIIGYSFIFKLIISENKNVKIYNLDFIYGIFFITLILILANYFIPISVVKVPLAFLGLILFLYGFFKKKIAIDYVYFSFFLLIFSVFTYYNSNNVDSPVYHIQTINWIHNYKITFGLAILDWHYALNSIWHILLAGLSLQYKDFNSIYVIAYIPFSFIFAESIKIKSSKELSHLTLFLCTSFLFFFSIIHPYKNGIIFNHLGNPEVDTVGMVFFIAASFIFIRYIETKNKDYFYLLVISSVICPMLKLTYIGALIYPLIASYYHKQLNIMLFFNKISIFSFFLFVFWSLRNLILSSCFLFPIKSTCVNFSWSLSDNQVLFYLNQTKSFARDTTLRSRYTEFDYTIYSYDWILPWFKDYFVNDAFLNITISIFILSFFLIFLIKLISKNQFNSKTKFFLITTVIFYIINFYIWFQAPEIRFGWGILLFFPCALLAMMLIEINLFKIPFSKYIASSLIILSIILVNKNLNNFKFLDLIKPFGKNFDYSQIIKLIEVNNFKIYQSLNWQCADFRGICINKPKKHYFIEKRKNYLFISTKDKKTN